MYYVWGIGNVSNNIVESYSLWMGLSLAKEMGIQNLLALGDSMLIICAMENKKGVGNNALNSLLLRIKCLPSNFEGISFLHIKRELNSMTDHWEKLVSHLNPETLVKNEVVSSSHIP
jgi:ribonuclease HI